VRDALRVVASLVAAGVLLLAVAACDRYPRDPEGSLSQARSQGLRVGVAPDPPFVVLAPGQPPLLSARCAALRNLRARAKRRGIGRRAGAMHRVAAAGRATTPAARTERLEWSSLGLLASVSALRYLAMGGSQAMKTAWVEDGRMKHRRPPGRTSSRCGPMPT
jgi:hypothetical protein